ncbi:hypothetical protein [Acinetobacter baumannii]|uniref:hypothetical protein n=1 Tax=Acinetobacter baumannii TaxID=470 RepID=UPI0013D50626|nr:hypothetical protein [Acinetobacter baumannii]
MKTHVLLAAFIFFMLGCSEPKKEELYHAPEKVEHETWKVVSHKDEMRETEDKWLSLRSDNSADLSSPYNGDNRLTLHVIDSKTKSPEIVLIIDDGQYDCDSMYGCYISTKFGNSKIQELHFTVDNYDGSSGRVLRFQGKSDAFVQNIRAFKQIMVEIPFYKDGHRQFKFNTNGFSEKEKSL